MSENLGYALPSPDNRSTQFQRQNSTAAKTDYQNHPLQDTFVAVESCSISKVSKIVFVGVSPK